LIEGDLQLMLLRLKALAGVDQAVEESNEKLIAE
jgi:hypothetical protein